VDAGGDIGRCRHDSNRHSPTREERDATNRTANKKAAPEGAAF
jgi:hypothetical protein